MPARGKSAFIAALTLAAFLSQSPAGAQAPDAFYRGKSVDLLLGYAPGGLNDTLSRVVARHIGKKFQASPT